MAKQRDDYVINMTHATKYAFECVRLYRPGWKPTQISKKDYLAMLNEKVKRLIRDSIKRHPSNIKTIKQFF